MIPALPVRNVNIEIPKLFKFGDFIGVSDNTIKINMYSGIYIDDTELFKNNFDLFLRILKSGEYSRFYSKDYEALKFIEDNLKDTVNIELGLVDDFDMKDRSYIDTNYFEKTSFILPLAYSMWNVNLKSDPKVSCYYDKNNLNPISVFGVPNISLDGLKQIKEIVLKLNEQLVEYTELEKIILISNYIQNNVQYVDENNISVGQKGTYITDSNGLEVGRNVHSAENVIKNHYGVCEGIANATTLLLNNPILSVNTRSVFGSGHVWNVVEVDGKYYYVDNTWAITRNNNQYEESLKAKSFDDTYLLFGSDTSDKIGYHVSSVYTPQIETVDYSKQKIEDSKKILTKKVSFDNCNPPVFESKLKK